jgi:hypothetical protein
MNKYLIAVAFKIGFLSGLFSQTCLDTLVFLSVENHYKEYEHHLKYFSNGKIFFTYSAGLPFCSESLNVRGINVVFCPMGEFVQWRHRKNKNSVIIQIDKIAILPNKLEFEIIGGRLSYGEKGKSLSIFSTNKFCYWLSSEKYGVIENCE